VNEVEVGFGLPLRVEPLLEPGDREPLGVDDMVHLSVGHVENAPPEPFQTIAEFDLVVIQLGPAPETEGGRE
jgi:hypothetical protein